MKNLLAFLALVLMLSSCSTLHIEQRKYRKGWYVENSSRTKKDKPQSTPVAAEENTPAQAGENVTPAPEAENTETAEVTALPAAETPSATTAPAASVNEEPAKPAEAAKTYQKTKPQAQSTLASHKAHSECAQPAHQLNKPGPKFSEAKKAAKQMSPLSKILLGLLFMIGVGLVLGIMMPFFGPIGFFLGLAFLIAGIADAIQKRRGKLTPESSSRNFIISLIVSAALAVTVVLVFIVLLIMTPITFFLSGTL
ncbi:MAG: hypothetical protein MUC87_13955 [Bacteroidia bacterium]|jgi:hypothetical protein|nr:hypothetical protein [Bacteroidia bacterium]